MNAKGVVCGPLIREARERAGLSTYKLHQRIAEMVDLDPSHLYRIEGGERLPSLPLLMVIAEALDRPISDLVMFQPDEQTDTAQV